MYNKKASKKSIDYESTLQDLVKEIEINRKNLNDKVVNNENNLVSEEMVLLSQNLDELIIEYIKRKSDKASKGYIKDNNKEDSQ